MGGSPYDGLHGEVQPEGSIFFRLQVYERVGISLDEAYKRASALIAALAASLAVLKEKRTKFKNLRKKQKDLIFQKLIYTGEISSP